MPEITSNRDLDTVEALRAHDGPTLDTLAVVSAATSAGRRRVRRRRGVTVLAAAVLAGSMGTGWALTTTGDDEHADGHIAPAHQDADALREPLRGSHHHRVVAGLTDRQVVSVTPDPTNFTAYDPDSSPARDYWLQEPRSSNFTIDGYLAIVQFTWGKGDGFTPAEADLMNSMRTSDSREAPTASVPFGSTPIEYCRALQDENPGSPGTCTQQPDGTAFAVSDFRDADAGQVRAVDAFHPDGWVQSISLHSRTGHSAGNIDLGVANMPTTDELLTFLQDGDWFE